MSTQQVPETTREQLAKSGRSPRKILLENEQVLVIESTYPVGGGVPMHTHRYSHVIYVIEGGMVEITTPDGMRETLEVRRNEAFWAGPRAHSTRNVGSTPVRIVEVEVKGAPPRIAGDGQPLITTPRDLDWIPDPLDRNRRSTLLLGDPTKPGPYVVRMRSGAGYHIGLHLHPEEDEHLTVLSGAVHWSTGAAGSGAPEHLAPTGSYLIFPAGTPHRLWTTEETELQMTGIGPRSYRYLEPEAEEAEHGPADAPVAQANGSDDGE